MGYTQIPITGIVDDKPHRGKFPIYCITNLKTGEYVEVPHQNIELALTKVQWDSDDVEFVKNGYSHEFGRILKRTRKDK